MGNHISLLYLVTNPVASGLVAKSDQWPGVLLWAPEDKPVEHTFRWWNCKCHETELDARFPAWSFPPWRPLVRVADDTA